MNRTRLAWTLGALLALAITSANAGPLDPDCTAEKAAKSTAMKATVGVGGRCDPKEALQDTAKDATGIGDKDKDKNKDDNRPWCRDWPVLAD